MTSSYTYPPFFDALKKYRFRTALEIGSLHGLDAIEVIKAYSLDRIFVIECNPECVQLCKKNLSAHSQAMVLEMAAWHEDSEISFYPVENSIDRMNGAITHQNEMHRCNIGASSCYKTSDPAWHGEKYFQSEIKVKARRLDRALTDLGVESIDLICMDAQGAELNALKGLGNYLNGVKAIITEAEIEPMYHGQSLLKDIMEHLNSFGFRLEHSWQWSVNAGDFLFTKS
jgi:FkbM family methyltransferase